MTASDTSGAGSRVAGSPHRAALSRSRSYLGLLLPVALAVVWELGVAQGIVSGRLMPPPSRIAATLYGLAREGELFVHIGATLWRVASCCRAICA